MAIDELWVCVALGVARGEVRSATSLYVDDRYIDGCGWQRNAGAWLLILTAIADQPRHGYGIMKEVAEVSDGNVTLRAGTLYAALDRFVTSGLVEVDREEIVDGRHRRFYRLTEAGRVELSAQAARLAGNARLALQRLDLLTEGGA